MEKKFTIHFDKIEITNYRHNNLKLNSKINDVEKALHTLETIYIKEIYDYFENEMKGMFD